MAPLYKRYIPPKAPPQPDTVRAAPQSTADPVSSVVTNDTPKKRKRERTDVEVAERKAKKLRKKGIDPATVTQENSVDKTRSANGPDRSEDTTNGDIDESTKLYVPEGDFAHITAGKKRHKLEKKAREARKAQKAETIPHTTPKEDKASRKKKDKNRHAEVPPTFSQDVHAEDDIREGGEDLSASRPKKRRHKLEAALVDVENETQASQPEPEDDLQKHAGVMSRYERSKQQSKPEPSADSSMNKQSAATEAPTILDLAPLPQPEKASIPEFHPDPPSLPTWLAQPRMVSSDAQASFSDLRLDAEVVQHLSKLGFENAMPVQQELIPLLLPPGSSGARFLPGSEPALPDIAVGAPTGGGKTIAYLLPTIESIKKSAGLGKTKALIVVPTRELVTQVAAVAESLAQGTRLKVGIATGTGSFKEEQSRLFKIGRRYDPEEYRKLMDRAHRRNYPPAQDSDEFEEYLGELENQDAREEKRVDDAVATLVNHVPTYESTVDVLVATPGRLLEHLDHTLGFNLVNLEWLILDEADKLVDSQYDGFLQAVNAEMSRARREHEQDAREKYLRSNKAWDEHHERRIRKVVLSATMTQDISKLMELKLKRPQMLFVRSDTGSSVVDVHGSLDLSARTEHASNAFELPPGLLEYCVPVGDGSDKPLYLVEVLAQRIFDRLPKDPPKPNGHISAYERSDITTSDSESSDSEPSSESSSDASEDVDQSTNHNGEHAALSTTLDQDTEPEMHPDRMAVLERAGLRHRVTTSVPTVLIFTSSTESANRLSHLLKVLKSDWSPRIKTMTRASGKKCLSNVKSADPIIVISTDRAARGLDMVANRPITHVMQYDVPRSATGHIHRVGRTARAGRQGEAWTLYTHAEARWFHQGVAKSAEIKRTESIEKVKFTIDQAKREDLTTAVAGMRDEVLGRKKIKSA